MNPEVGPGTHMHTEGTLGQSVTHDTYSPVPTGWSHFRLGG